ncbi:GNAT family N-acetyltransferase [Bdellovibrio bacteriovorus]|uniref:GNAT family N-acetyltransferase n=1 Tax=Bdellovibrio bacteriovorus TaxID=959 RepID=UPI0035A8DDB1
MQIVRRAKPEDALGIHEAHMRSIREVCSKDHLPQEIQGWGNRPYREDQRVNAIKNQFVWVVDNSGRIEGYGHLSITSENGRTKGHVMGLYLVPEANGKGFGVTIAKEMIAEARKQNAFEINLESTLTAHSFYKKMGFVDAGELATIELGGSKIRYIPMKMAL